MRGEYEDITNLLDKPVIYGDIFKYYKLGKKAICYCSSIKHSIRTAEEFNLRGITAEHIDGQTPKIERERIINDFRSGKIMVLCNYALISEGFDVPDCDMVLILRKTTSLNLFIQMSMRCMRYQKNKIATILDFCGNAYEHGLPDDDRIWTLDSKIKQAKNISAEPDILVRSCKNCFLTYAGNNRICPYCEFDNGKTKKEIEQDKQAELEQIKEIQKRQDRIKVAKAETLNDLIKIGIERKYKNPVFWANKIFKARKEKNKMEEMKKLNKYQNDYCEFIIKLKEKYTINCKLSEIKNEEILTLSLLLLQWKYNIPKEIIENYNKKEVK